MKSRKTASPLDGLKAFKEVSEENRQVAYENKICKKILNLIYDGSDESSYTDWSYSIKDSADPLLTLSPLFGSYTVRSFRLETWGISDLFLRPTKCPVWKAYKELGSEIHEAFPDQHPAMVFYNSALSQDMVIHSNVDSAPPPGHFRMIRISNSEEGGIVIDTLAGFVKTL